MAINAAQVPVSTTATRLNSDPHDSRSDSAIAITAPAAAVLYLGRAGVSTATGFPLPAGTTISLDLQSSEDVYGVLATGTGTVSVLETGV